MSLVGRYREWLRQAVIVRRIHVLVQNLVFGVMTAASLLLAILAVHQLDVEREARLKDALRGQLTASEVKVIAKRTARLEAPTDAQLVRQITDRLRRCLRLGGCRQTIRQTLMRVLSYARIQTGPRGPAGRPGRDAVAKRGPPGPTGKTGPPGHDVSAPEIVEVPAKPDPRVEVNARLLQDLDELLAALTGRVDRLGESLRCIARQPLNLLRCL